MSEPLLREYKEKDFDEEAADKLEYFDSPSSSPIPLPVGLQHRLARPRRPLYHYLLVACTSAAVLYLFIATRSGTPAGGSAAPPTPNSGLGSSASSVKTFWEGDPRENRLRELLEDYNKEKEGFGVGHANLNLYRAELLEALEELVGVSQASAIDELDYNAPVEPLAATLLCHLDTSCAEGHRIPHELFATAKVVDPLPTELVTWKEINGDHDLRLFDNDAVSSWIHSRFPNSSIPSTFDNLPMPILRYDLFRLLVLLTRGGTYTDADTVALRPISEWARDAVDLTDPILSFAATQRPSLPPSLIVGIEWTGHTERNQLNPLYTRSVGVVQWTFSASKAHPVILDATRRVIENSRRVASGEFTADEDGEDPLHFDPEAARAVLEWSGPAVLSDAVARYLRTRWGVSLASVAHFDHPVRIGDVVLLPIAALQAQDSYLRKMLDWALGRNFAPFTKEHDLVAHEHAASWWTQKPKKDDSKAVAGSQ